MAPVTFTAVTINNNRFPIVIDDEEDVFTLLSRVAETVGIPKEYTRVVVRGTATPLVERKNSTIRDLQSLQGGNKDLLVARTYAKDPRMTGRTPNTRSLVDPNEMRYHRRILGQNLQRIYEARGLRNVANKYGLPENLEREITRGYLGHPKRGGKTRKSKKSRRATRRRR